MEAERLHFHLYRANTEEGLAEEHEHAPLFPCPLGLTGQGCTYCLSPSSLVQFSQGKMTTGFSTSAAWMSPTSEISYLHGRQRYIIE